MLKSLQKYLIVGSGGVLGALARYWLGGLFKVGPGDFPAGTFLINLTGSFILGLFLTLITQRFVIRDEWRLFFATGFVGAYTTFSSFSNEVLTLFRQGYATVGVLYSAGSLLGGMLFVWLGYELARFIGFGTFNHTAQEAALLAIREKASLKNAKATGTIPTGNLPMEERSELEKD